MRAVAADPNPKDEQGRRKPNLALVPPSSVIHMSTAFMDGAQKYGPYNWRKTGVSMMVYLRALNSHYQLFLDGEDYDPKTKVHHLAYVMANCAIILDGTTSEGVMVDDRPPPGAAAKLTERFVEHGHLVPNPSFVRGVPSTPEESTMKHMHNDARQKLDKMVQNLEGIHTSLTELLDNHEYVEEMELHHVQNLRMIRDSVGQDLNSAYAAQKWDDRGSPEGMGVYEALVNEKTRRAQNKR